jgi:exonuclease SbcC
MIKTLHIANFQSHKDTLIEFDPGVNIIVGASDSGKTAIIRALRWLITNRPSGDAFRSMWGGDTSVMMDNITRVKGKNKNGYTYDENEYQAAGADVPESVAQALNFSDLSWQGQMDSPFLLSASSGEVARALNEVADLDKIDSTLSNANRMIRDNRAALLASGQQVSAILAELTRFVGLDKRLALCAKLKEQERRADALEELAERGDALLADVGRAENEKAKFKNLSQAEEMLNGLMDMVGQVQDAEAQAEKAQVVLATLERKQFTLDGFEKEINKLEKQWSARFPEKCPLCGK